LGTLTTMLIETNTNPVLLVFMAVFQGNDS
jgi:hypothetical protein